MATDEHSSNGRRARVTIQQLATELGVSKAAVSFALNDKPGVSEETRQRVLAAAGERGWAASMAARALSGQGTGSIGLVLARDATTLAFDNFYLRFIAGIQAVLSPRDLTLTFQLVDTLEAECAVYRRWVAQERVDAVIVVDLHVRDPRLPLLDALGLPAVIVGDRGSGDGPFAEVWTDDIAPMTGLVNTLVELGHEQIGLISGLPSLRHTERRVQAMQDALGAHGLSALATHYTDYSREQGAAAMADLLDSEERPTAVIADSDQLALGALTAARAAGARIPQDVGIVSWEDTPLCEITDPQLAALRRDPFDLGSVVASALLDQRARRSPTSFEGVAPELIIRGSLTAR
ncbi:LacI family DNA-binding transcriptional regulator [Ruania rhizosphaerae]|uniref:LacI family DNA-binding transcriptional regulator n=1 Tax=Ruania rhizosphaerae TaxID=1840413 RepID=UPI0013588FE3|nr:LacI family DNA-binding transcriptional regulator [Ruania rhizosphaerae]